MAACNFNPDATEDDGTCEYAEAYYDCAGNCLNDADGDGVCNKLEVDGCRPRWLATSTRATNDVPASAEQYYDCDGNASTTQTAMGCVTNSKWTNARTRRPATSTLTPPKTTTCFRVTCDDGDDTTINDVLNDECDCVGEVDGPAKPRAVLDLTRALCATSQPSPRRRRLVWWNRRRCGGDGVGRDGPNAPLGASQAEPNSTSATSPQASTMTLRSLRWRPPPAASLWQGG